MLYDLEKKYILSFLNVQQILLNRSFFDVQTYLTVFEFYIILDVVLK